MNEWMNDTLFRQVAHSVRRLVSKGGPVSINYCLHEYKYNFKNLQAHYIIYIILNDQ